MGRRLFFAALMAAAAVFPAEGQDSRSLADGLQYQLSAEGSFSGGDHTPLWLTANKYGLSSLDKSNGYLRVGVGRPLSADSLRRWGVGYGADVAVAGGYTSTLVVQQAWFEARWLKGVLTVGSKEQPVALKNQQLSSGAQTLGANARPVPQIRLALPDYWVIPGLKSWAAFKGHMAYGMTTDDGWQHDFTGRQNPYTEHTLYHEKAGYLRIGPKNITLEVGLEMAAQFGGKSHVFVTNSQLETLDNGSGPKAFFRAFVPGGSDATENNYQNAEGNHVGSWVARLNMDFSKWYLGVYADHFFEDHSSMFFLDYDGYGQGEEWNVRKDRRYFLYDLKDILVGAELKLKDFPWADDFVAEFISTKYQCGPVYHDHARNNSDHISGRDDYYNHYLFTGWQHWGMVMGNPLYRSPLYNDDGKVEVKNNRFTAWHFGLGGHPADGLSYRLLASFQKGYGSYYNLFPDPENSVSLLAEAQYRFKPGSPLGGWSVRCAVGMDSGGIYGDNHGVQLTVTRHGLLKK